MTAVWLEISDYSGFLSADQSAWEVPFLTTQQSFDMTGFKAGTNH